MCNTRVWEALVSEHNQYIACHWHRIMFTHLRVIWLLVGLLKQIPDAPAEVAPSSRHTRRHSEPEWFVSVCRFVYVTVLRHDYLQKNRRP